jgi:hypothetical protein
MDAAFWTALGVIATAIATVVVGAIGYLNNRLKVQPQLAAMKAEIQQLREMEKGCAEDRKMLAMPYPRDTRILDETMDKLRGDGRECTVRDAAAVIILSAGRRATA